MAKRPVFFPISRVPYVDVYQPEFPWNGGFAVSQKRKNIDALHEAFLARFPGRNPLEISSKSAQPLGVSLSAFNLKKSVPSLGISVPVECVFQGGKVFSGGGPFTDLYTVSPRDAKRDPRLKERGMLKSFYYEGETYPTVPGTAFYDWLYIKALLENLASKITPKWLEVNKENGTAKVIALPAREDIDFDFNEQLIVELYSK